MGFFPLVCCGGGADCGWTDCARYQMIGDLVSKETVCCVGGKVKH